MGAGRHINDHGNWIGAKPKGTVFPAGPHKLKEESEASSFGSLNHYEDTTEKIKEQQNMNTKKVHGHPQKPGHRN